MPFTTTVEEFVEHARGSFKILRLAPYFAVAGLPLTYWNGGISGIALFHTVWIGTLWTGSFLMAWRWRSEWLHVLGFAIVYCSFNMVGLLHADLPFPQSLQLACWLFIVMGAPLLLFQTRLRRFARLERVEREKEVNQESKKARTAAQ